jgi:epoxyqueuosine reductase
LSQNQDDAGSLAAFARRRALELGFHAVGIATVEPLAGEARRVEEWVAAGRHAGLGYMARWHDVRRDPRHGGMVAGARSVVSVALAYDTEPERQPSGIAAHLSAFARGPDYHGVVRDRLQTLLADLAGLAPGLRGRALVDSAPVLERAWAVRAGLGFVGRNTCLIHPTLGSTVVLGELIVTTALDPGPPPGAVDGCGSCRACVVACPTGALAAPDGHVLDARRCLSYWSVEAKGPPPPDLAALLPLFGCDACQDACPYNCRRARPESPLRALPRWRETSVADVAAMPLERLAELLRGTPLARAGAAAIRERARARAAAGRGAGP